MLCPCCAVPRWRADELLDRHQQAVNQVRADAGPGCCLFMWAVAEFAIHYTASWGVFCRIPCAWHAGSAHLAATIPCRYLMCLATLITPLNDPFHSHFALPQIMSPTPCKCYTEAPMACFWQTPHHHHHHTPTCTLHHRTPLTPCFFLPFSDHATPPPICAGVSRAVPAHAAASTAGLRR
jgi:hypothetical protein